MDFSDWLQPARRGRLALKTAFGLSVLIPAAALSACGRDAEEPVERIRPIKPYVVSEPASGVVRRYSGQIAAATSSTLSFAVGGTVETVAVSNGDVVSEGQILATIDASTYELALDSARSELAGAQADFENARVNLDRQKQLFDKGWVAQAALDQARAGFDVAEAQLELARSRVGLAQRDLERTRLRAPFDGSVTDLTLEPFVEAPPGQAVMRLEGGDGYEAEFAVPDAVVRSLAVGAPVTVTALTAPGCGCTGRIIEIGASAGSANAVPVTAAVNDAPVALVPGMAVEVGVALSNAQASNAFLVPLVAVAPGDEDAPGYVFKYDAVAGVVRRTPIRGGAGVIGNALAVSEGLAAGDVIAGAGVSFLRDGQAVRLLGDAPAR